MQKVQSLKKRLSRLTTAFMVCLGVVFKLQYLNNNTINNNNINNYFLRLKFVNMEVLILKYS